MSTAGPFSLLLEWLSSPVVSGCFALFGIGLIIEVILVVLICFFDKRDNGAICVVLFVLIFVVLFVTGLCIAFFSEWAGAING